jgi:SAM-dependent methyltransferase
VYVYRCFVGYQLKDYQTYRPFFESKIGLELGGPSNVFSAKGFFPVYPIAGRVDNCTFSAQTIWRVIDKKNGFIFHPEKAPGNQYIAEAGDLHFVADDTYDFILSSHCIEHLANPLKGLLEWKRVLKPNGFFLLVVPHKDGAFDHLRPVTTLEHLIHDYQQGTPESDLTHLDEILRLHDFTEEALTREAFLERGRKNLKNRCLHHHVFDVKTTLAMVDFAGYHLRFVSSFLPFHVVVVAERPGVGGCPSGNAAFLTGHPGEHWTSPFPTDR